MHEIHAKSASTSLSSGSGTERSSSALPGDPADTSAPLAVVPRRFTREGIDPLDEVEWETRDAVIRGADGTVVFEQRGVSFPRAWSQAATDVVTQKYFRGRLGTPGRESSARSMICRVAETISAHGSRAGYLSTPASAQAFRDELVYLLLHQRVAFNSPVWFNVGVDARPQCSACFINSVADSMDSIMELAQTEAMLFKYGSGAGSNLSTVRSSHESLSGGGSASGPIAFMRGFDAFAGAIKSGGKTRRAAKMVILDASHPDVIEFVECKVEEERKAQALIAAGYDGNFDVPGGAYDSVDHQNANHSVRVPDAFMQAVVDDGPWQTRAVTDGRIVEEFPARHLMRRIAAAAWACGDPGIQFDTTINDWHTCAAAGRISASNPCSEYMFLDDTACNLASLNLRKFQGEDGEVCVEEIRHAVHVTILAMDILVDLAGYPTPRIAEMSRRFRTLGLGYANLGALLMSKGLPYDSDAARAYAAAITALVAGEAYRASALLARDVGPFEVFAQNKETFLSVVRRHRDALSQVDAGRVPADLLAAAREAWDGALELGARHGFRNAQGSVLAPTGTIAFLMDCDTTGIEPDVALVKSKRLVGGGSMQIINRTVPEALAVLGYTADEASHVLAYMGQHGMVEGCRHLRDEHLAVFDCALAPPRGSRSIHYLGHLRMMAAVQPFLSGAISKTVNLPASSTIADVEDVYLLAWRMGLKSIAVYRDGCKRTQPLSTAGSHQGDGTTKLAVHGAVPVVDPLALLTVEERRAVQAVRARRGQPSGPPVACRHRLPIERESKTHKFSIGGHDGYVTVGLYDDGSPGEIFVRMAKEGSPISGLMDSFATAVSLALQHGTPLRVLIEKFRGTRFEPSGFTKSQSLGIEIATSIVDYLFRWLALRFPRAAGVEEDAAPVVAVGSTADAKPQLPSRVLTVQDTGAPACPTCGMLMVRSGACHRCMNCGSTSGCS